VLNLCDVLQNLCFSGQNDMTALFTKSNFTFTIAEVIDCCDGTAQGTKVESADLHDG
jgi:hypothetical protein